MVTRDSAWPAGTPCWVELGTDDIGGAAAFYTDLLGWEVQRGEPEVGGYSMCLLGGREVAAIGPRQGPPSAPIAWTVYLATDDADATAAAVAEAGGQVLTEPVDVMDAGRMAVAADPGGAVFGLWQARAFGGFRRVNEPGAVTWSESFSRDLDAGKDFYHAVFGYEFGDVSGAGMRYATLKVGGAEVGGIGELGAGMPADVPAHWSTYFAVTGTDAAVAVATAAGGSVFRPASDTPYGRVAVVRDAQGAYFSLLSAPGGAT